MTVALAPPSDDARPSRSIDARGVVRAAKRLLRGSGGAAALSATIALVRACAAPSPPPKTLDGLVSAIASAAHVVVKNNEFVWERDEGVLVDFARGRHILFLGAAREGSPRDLYRARVRLTPEGRPLEVRDVVNLSSTPLGDEQGLVRDETAERAAFATYAYGQLQGLTALDLRGEGRASKATSALERAMLFVTNVQETGDGDGIARVQIMLEKEATAALLSFDGETLVVALQQAQGGVKVARVDVDQAELQAPVDGVHVEQLPRVPKKFIHWAVDTVRAVPWIGPEPIAWLEAKVWELRDRWHRFRYKMESSGGAQDEVKTEEEQQRIIAKMIDPTAAGEDGGYWPPQRVPTIYKTPEEGEGEWSPVDKEWMHRLPGAPSPFYRTFIRPDPERPYSKIILIAMDTRQLDFDMEAGVDDPKPTVGSFHGTGRLPREPSIAKRAVAAFNGGFKSEHGHYGMMLKKHILLPPVPTAATAIVTDDGRFGMGAWAPTREIPVDLLSYRQNMDPLIDDGIINPRHRGSWGAVLPGQPRLTGQQTERSGLCLTRAGHVLYVWGDDVGPDALGKAMQLAGCDFGMHLDMNPFHTGFVFMSFDDAQYKSGHSETLTPLMAISNRRYIDYNPKDFFYVMLRDTAAVTAGGGAGAVDWVPDLGVQPPPLWLPAIWRGAESGVSLTAFDAGRVRFAVRAGVDEKLEGAATIPREISGEDAARAIAAIGLGVADPKHPLGLTLAGKPAMASSEGAATLVVRADGKLSIAAPGEPTPAGAIDLVQGAMLVVEGRPAEGVKRASGSFERVAIGVTKEGRVIVAREKASTDDGLTSALISAGCVRAIAARGAIDSFVARAGTAESPMTSYPQTTLYALAQPMGPRAFRFDRGADGKPLFPAVTAPVP